MTINLGVLNTFFLILFLFFLFSCLTTNKKDNKNCNIKFLTILLENIILIYKKTFIKIANLIYFDRLKKYNKIYNYIT